MPAYINDKGDIMFDDYQTPSYQGPGLGSYGDFAQFDAGGNFSGVSRQEGPGLGIYGDTAQFDDGGNFTGVRNSDDILGSSSSRPSGGGYSKSSILSNLGLSTNLYEDLQNRYGITADQAPDLVGKIRGNIEDVYGGITKFYNKQLGAIPGRQQQDLSYLDAARANQLGQLQSAQNVANQGLDQARQGVVARRAESVRELGGNLRSLMDATRNRFGALGASDSSASQVAAPYAFSKLGSQARGDITRQANEQFAEIDLRKNQVTEEYNRQRSGVEQWLSDKQFELRNYYQNLQDRINEQKVNADAARLQALNQLEEGLLAQAQAQQNYFMQQAVNFETGVREWALNQMNDINAAARYLQGQGNVPVQQISTQPLSGLDLYGVSGSGAQTRVSGKKDEEEE